MPKIVLLDRETLGEDAPVSKFEQVGELEVHARTAPGEVSEHVGDAEIIVVNKVLLGENLQKNPSVKMICLTATGYNNVDLDYCKSHGIAVMNVVGYSTDSVAQHTILLALSVMESLPYYLDFTKSGKYSQSGLANHIGRPFREITGKTWGIIGLGAIGRRVAAIAEAFGAKVQYFSSSGVDREERYKRVSLEELLKTSDVVSVHAALNEKTKGLLGREEFRLMKPGAILINVARGAVLDEGALAEALDEGELFGAGVDVFSEEPFPENHPYQKMKHPEKLQLTPHIAWASNEARVRVIDEILLNIEDFYKGGTRNRVDLK